MPLEDLTVFPSSLFQTLPANTFPTHSLLIGFENNLGNGIGSTFVNSLVLNPTLLGSDADDVLVGTQQPTLSVLGGAGNDILAGGLGNALLLGNEGNDIVRGDRNSRAPGGIIGGDDLMFGGEGDDRLGGKGGNDWLVGGLGDDHLWGDHGNDVLYGGPGQDSLTGDDFSGGTGDDIFVFVRGEATDTITDFGNGDDRILLLGLLPGDQVELLEANGNTLLSLNNETLAVIENVTNLSNDVLLTPDSFPDAVLADIALANDTGTNASDRITTDPTIIGSVLNPEQLNGLLISLNSPTNAADITDQVQADGQFVLTPQFLEALQGSGLTDGEQTLFFQTVNADGSLATPVELTFTLDTTPPDLSLALVPAFDSAPVGDQQTTFDTIALTGQTEAGATVTLLDIGTSTTADATGQFSFTDIALAIGSNSFTATVVDLAGNTTSTTLTLERLPVNQLPTVDADKSLTVEEDSGVTPLAITPPTDADGDPLTITVDSLPNAAKGGVQLADGRAIAPGQTLTITELAGLQFVAQAETNGDAGTFRYTVADGQGGAASQAITISITPVNDAPSLTLPAPQTTLDNATLAIAGISVSDIDAGTQTLEVTLTTTNGSLTLAQTTGLDFSTGDGIDDANLVFQGSLADLNAALATLTYQSDPGFSGPDAIAFTVDDLGNTGSGGALTDSQTLAIEVTASDPETAEITGLKWEDLNENGVLDSDEIGLAGVEIYLDLNQNGQLDTDEPTQITDVTGIYRFTDLAAGTYQVREVVAPGYAQTYPLAREVNAGDGFADVVLGYVPTGSNSGTDNPEAVLGAPPAGELSPTNPHVDWLSLPEGSAVTVGFADERIVDTPGDDLLIRSFTGTDAAGERAAVYVSADGLNFELLGTVVEGGDVALDLADIGFTQPVAAVRVVGLDDPGFDLLSVEAVPGSALSPDFHTVTLAAGEIATDIDFGNKLPTGEIRGRKWQDADGDGIQDSGEAGLAGLTIYLDQDNDGQFDPGELSTLTEADGQYRFRDLTAGDYTVREVLPIDARSTFPVDGRYELTLSVGEIREGIDFGNQPLPQLTNANRAPEFLSDPILLGTEGTEYGYQPIVLDPDGDALTFTLLEGPEGLSIEAATGLLRWVPNTDQVGETPITIQVSDEEGLTDTQTFNISVDPRQSNTAPVFVSQPLTEFANASLGSASGGVSPTQLNLQLADGEVFTDTIAITAGEQVPMVDVLLLLDDTGSFAESGPLLVAQFPGVIEDLETRFPDVDFGFGLARYEDYAGVGAGDRPNTNRLLYALNSPIVSSDEPGFDTAFASALERSIPDPGLGGAADRPEALIEGLFQVATGAGFDGNGDGDTTDNGAAGSFAAQTNFFAVSNEVPTFASYSPFPIDEVRNAAQPALSIQITEDANSTVVRTGTPLEFGEIVGGAITAVGEENVFTFSLTERTLVYMDEIEFSTGTTPDLDLESNLLPSNRNFDDERIADLPAGDYNIVVNSPLSILTGEYAFRLLKLEDAVDLNFNAPVSGTIAPIKETDIFQFEAEAGDVIFLDINSDFDPISTRTEWRLLNPSQATTQSGRFDPSGVETLFRVDESGTQTLLLEGAFAFSSVNSVDYDIEIQKIPETAFEATSDRGGVGFRAGALPIILATADSETVYQPDGIDTITGVNGVELPLSSFIDAEAGRLTTPGDRGASVQPTIDALNDLGALVIGLGADINNIGGLNTSGSDPTVAPRRTLEGIATLTGAVNTSANTIDSGIDGDPIESGEPLYFLISQDSGERIAAGIAAGVEAALTATSFDIDLSASSQAADFQNLTGVVSGVAPGEQAEFDIELTGDGSAQAFELLFTRPGTGIILGSIPVSINNGYFYAAQAVDADGDTLRYSLIDVPAGATIDPDNGQLQWNPSGPGVFDFIIQVDDGRGGEATQSFSLSITDASANNTEPVITSTPPTTVQTGSEFDYQVLANDADGDALNYYLVTAPEGMRIEPDSGNITWTPSVDQIGSQEVVVRTIDARGATTSQHFTVEVGQNQSPVFSSSPNRTGEANEPYTYDVDATDPEGSDIIYSLRNGAPEGMTINPETGLIQWVPTTEQEGQVPITVLATDADGGEAAQSFLVNVGDFGSAGGIGSSNGEDPAVFLGYNTNLVNIGEEFTLQVRAVDNESLVSLMLTADGVTIPLTPGDLTNGAINEATLQFADAGLIDLVAMAVDNDGNLGTETLTLRVIDPNDTTSPDIAIDLSGLELGVPLTSPYEIAGTIEAPDLEFYRVEVAPLSLVDLANPGAAGSDYQVLAEGSGSVDGVLATLDPRFLDNDEYFIRIVAQDVSGNINVQGFTAGVATPNKVGNFTLDATDLNIPLTGIPITVQRRYDTLQANQTESLGYGWDLIGADARITESAPVTDTNGVTSLFTATSFKAGDRVTLTAPDGERIGFTFTPEISGTSFLGPIFAPKFTPDPGVDAVLEVDNVALSQQADGSFGLFFIGFPYNPSTYQLTTQNNLTYTYDQFEGLQTIEDMNGNIVTYTDDGIFSSTGQSIQFERDERDRIIGIIDPEGERIRYEYDVNGDLVAVTDRLGNTTQYIYAPDNPHYLLEEIDPLGRSSVRTEYDDQGRLSQIIDAEGNVLKLDIDFDGPTDTQVITDALNNQVVLTYSDRGNIIQQVDPEGGITSYVYNGDNNLISLTDPRDNTTTYTYDDRGNQLTETDALGNTQTTTYNAANQVLTITDARGNTTTNQYDASGNLVEREDAIGNLTQYSYDDRGNLTAITDAKGSQSTYRYDTLGRLVAFENALGAVTSFTYDAFGNLQDITTPLGTVTTFEYDAEGRLIKITDAEANVTQIQYNAAGERTAVINALGRRTEFSYNDRGLQTEIRYADGTTAQTIYDSLDRVVKEIDQNGNETAFNYDGLNRLIAVVDALGNETTYDYDASGNLVAQTDALGRTTEFEYDAINRLVTTELALGQIEARTYDAVSNLASLTNFNGDTIAYEYDPSDRLMGVQLPDAPDEIYSYTPTGEIESVTDARGVTQYDYNNLGQLVRRTEPDGSFIAYSYDLDGNIETLTTPSGTVTYRYELTGLLSTVEDRQGGMTTYTYDALGNLTRTEFSNGITEIREYDLLNRPTLLETRNADGDLLSRYEYTLDDVGNRLTLEENTGRTVAYVYDDLYRLTQESITDPNNGNQVTNYVYDDVGNRQSLTNTITGTTTYSYDANARLLTSTTDGIITNYDYDDAGNLLTTVTDGETQVTHTWNSKGELSRAVVNNHGTEQVLEFQYNTDGIRVAATLNGVTTNFLVDATQQPFAQVIEEYENVGSPSAVYTYGSNLIAQQSAGTEFFYHTDGLGSTRLGTNNAGDVVNAYIYDAYGNLLQQTEGLANRYRYTGESFDSETENYYLRARYYDPTTGRFLTRDPFNGFLARPLSINKYTYVEGNPVNFVDPSGNLAAIEYVITLANVSGLLGSLSSGLVNVGVEAVSGENLPSFIAFGLGTFVGSLTLISEILEGASDQEAIAATRAEVATVAAAAGPILSFFLSEGFDATDNFRSGGDFVISRFQGTDFSF